MSRKFRIALVIGCLALASRVFAATGDPLDLRLDWKAGDQFRYAIDVTSEALAAGERAEVRLSTSFEMRVLDDDPAAPAGSTAEAAADAGPGPNSALSLGERPMRVELQFGQITMLIKISGRELKFVIDANGTEGYLNGNPLPSSSLDDLRRDLKALRDILGTRVKLVMTDRGRIVEVSGIERLELDTQNQLVASFFEDLLLPDRPLLQGESYIAKKNLESFFPNQPGKGPNPLAGRTVDIVRTLAEVKPGTAGRRVAVIKAPLRQSFKEVPLDADGTKGSLTVNLVTTTEYDVETGTPLSEITSGTLLFHPAAAGAPSEITVKVSGNCRLLPSSATPRLAALTGRN